MTDDQHRPIVGAKSGLYRLNRIDVQVPFHNIPTGSKIQLAIIQNGVQTQLMVPVQQ